MEIQQANFSPEENKRVFVKFLHDNGLGEYESKVQIDAKLNNKYKVKAMIMLDSVEGAERLVNNFDGKAGILGT